MARFPRLLGLALAAAFVAGVGAASSPAAPPVLNHTLTTAHFMVHYSSAVDPAKDFPVPNPPIDYTSETQAGDIAAYAERAYATYRSWGFPAPVADADGLIDIYVSDLPDDNQLPSLEAYAASNNAGPAPSAGTISVTNPQEIPTKFAKVTGLTPDQEEEKAVANEVFVMFEFATWVPTNPGDYWLLDGAAQWAAFQSMGYPAGGSLTDLAPPDMALDCRDDQSALPALGTPPVVLYRMCDPDRWTELGYTRWAFYQMLVNRYGMSGFVSFFEKALANGAAGDPATQALTDAIAATGGTLPTVFSDYTNDLMDGNFGVSALSSIRPPAHDDVPSGTEASTVPTTVMVPVNHLAARYVTFQRGDGKGDHSCFAASLTVKVSLHYGAASQTFGSISSQPYFYWDVSGSTPQPLTVDGSSASITVPWDTCNWGTTRGYLSLPNASTTVDAADFTVTMTQTVDTNTPATASAPPPQTSIWGTTVPTPTADVAPTIDVFGPELIKVSAQSRVIRLIVDSSGPGSVNAALGAAKLGGRQLRAGNNDLRFTVPAGLIGSLRRSASATNLLTLTPMSPSGASAGQAVTRHVAITATKAVKKKPKKK